MSVIFMDGFDHWDAGQYLNKWDSKSAGIIPSATYSRWPDYGKGLSLPSTYSISKNIQNTVTLVAGLAVNMQVLPAYEQFLRFKDGSTTQVSVYFDPTDYNIQVWRGDSTALLGETSEGSIVPYVEHYIFMEVKVVIDGSSGSVEIRVNEQIVLNLTSKNTQATGNAYVNRIDFCGGFSGSLTGSIDDVYLDNSDFLGDCRVKVFAPTSDGALLDFTQSTGNRYQCVDEIPPNEDTDYVYGSSVSDQQTFKFTVGSLPTIKSVQLLNLMKISDANIFGIKNLCRSNGSNYLETNEYTVDNNLTYEFHEAVWPNDPDDSNPWTQAKIEAAEFGLEITSIS